MKGQGGVEHGKSRIRSISVQRHLYEFDGGGGGFRKTFPTFTHGEHVVTRGRMLQLWLVFDSHQLWKVKVVVNLVSYSIRINIDCVIRLHLVWRRTRPKYMFSAVLSCGTRRYG